MILPLEVGLALAALLSWPCFRPLTTGDRRLHDDLDLGDPRSATVTFVSYVYN